MRPGLRPAVRGRLALVTAALALVASAPPAVSASGPPTTATRSDRAGDVRLEARTLARTSITRAQARAADILAVRYSTEDHDGVASTRFDLRLRQVLPVRERRYQQRIYHYVDEETVAVIRIGESRGHYVSTAGIEEDVPPGCRRGDVEVDGTLVTMWLPLRCQRYDAADMGPVSTVLARLPGERRRYRVAGTDSTPTTIGVAWR